MTYTAITEENAATFKVGTRVRFNYGPMHGSEDATITGFRVGRFGTTLIAETEEGREEHISGFTTVGIGAYLI